MTMILFLSAALFSREGSLCFVLNQIKRLLKTLARGTYRCKSFVNKRRFTNMDSRILKKVNKTDKLIVFLRLYFYILK